MMLKPRKEGVGLALDGWEIALCVFVAAAPLKQLFDRRSIGKHGLVNLDVREIAREAFFLDLRALRHLAPDAQIIKRRSQVLHHAGREDGHIAERRQRSLRLLDRVEKRQYALEPSEARLLDLASPSLRAEPLQLSAELFDIVVELYPGIAAKLLFANCLACSVEALERLIEAAFFPLARREHAIGFLIEGAAKFGEPAEPRSSRQKTRPDVAVRLQHLIASGAQFDCVQPERSLEHVLGKAAEKRRQRVVGQRITRAIEESRPAPLAAPEF